MRPLTRRLALTGIASLALVVPFTRGVFRSYIENSDPDIVFAYQGLQLNDQDNNLNAEHTGYVYFVLLAMLFRLARLVGLIDFDRTTPLLALGTEAFDAAYGELIFVGRGLSILLTVILVLVTYGAGRLITRSDGGGLIAATLTAVSWGTATQSLILRTELLSAIFVMAAFTALIAAARAPDARNAMTMFVGGLTAALAAATKLQALGPLMCVAVLAVAFGEQPPRYAGRLSETERWASLALLGLATVVAATPVAIMLVSGMVVRGSSGLYQAAIALYLVALVAGFARIYDVSPLRALTGFGMLTMGFSAGILSHLIYPNPAATDALAAFVEHMKGYAGMGAHNGAPFGAIVEALSDSALAALNRRVQGFAAPGWPLRLVELFIITAILVHAIREKWRTAGLTALLLATSYAIDVWSGLRNPAYHYIVYFDPWLALAAAMAATTLLQRARQTIVAVLTITGVASIAALQISGALRNPSIGPIQERANACYQAHTYMQRIAHKFDRYCPVGWTFGAPR